MIIPEWVRKNVVFVAYRMASGEMRFLGSAFFLGRAPEGYTRGLGPASGLRLVTARHLLDYVRKRGLAHIFVRVNNKNGEAVWIISEISDWKYHPTDPAVDLAMVPFGILSDWDHIAVPSVSGFTPALALEHEVALGEEVFIVGLFRHHRGQKRNIPIVRVGNLAALDEEKVQTAEGPIDAYLIEARSLGGLSGSPVFLNLGTVRQIKGRVVGADTGGGGPIIILLGLIHGHYDTPAPTIDSDADEGLTPERINTGIAIVVPAQKIMEAFDANSPATAQPVPLALRYFADAELADPNLVL
ncbi:MAG TPA: hypothetical protein VN325_44075 [Steroidobacteraceae bacterium]|nr:hypothetical protein [Steroidobacteraceae bacterium]